MGEPASSLRAPIAIGAYEADLLLDLAETAIRARLDGRRSPDVELHTLPAVLRRPSGAFVTLHVAGRLNGCIGNLSPDGPVAVGVAELAVKAAFEDPRLPPLRSADLDRLSIEVSLLSDPIEVPARTRTELYEHLRPREHGLVLRDRGRQALFLPSVWEQLPLPDDFVDQLLRKAGLSARSWPAGLVAELFTTTSFERDLG